VEESLLDTKEVIMAKKILVVDDEQEVVRAVQMSLEKVGFEVLTAQNGLQALAQVNTELPDLVVMDINMPVMNGFEAVQQLKADAATAHIPIVMLTSDQSGGSRAIGMEAGTDVYLTKPFHPRDLVKRVKAALRGAAIKRIFPRSKRL
jgi:DNA-binding response OmpR family regulator